MRTGEFELPRNLVQEVKAYDDSGSARRAWMADLPVADPADFAQRMADFLGLDAERLRHWLDVEVYGGQVAVQTYRFGFGTGPALVTFRAAPDGCLRVHIQPDAEVPVVVDFRAESEDAVDDQHGVRRGPRHYR